MKSNYDSSWDYGETSKHDLPVNEDLRNKKFQECNKIGIASTHLSPFRRLYET